MAYKVFISHSVRDQGWVMALTKILLKLEIKVSVAEWYLSPRQPISEKVFNQIEKSDCVVVLLTQNGVRSNWVYQEIEYAIKSKKPLIPLVEKQTYPTDLGALQGIEYIEYNPDKPNETLIKISTYVKSLKLKKEERQKALLIVCGIGAFLLEQFLSEWKK